MIVVGLFAVLLPFAILAAIVVAIARTVRGNQVDWGQLVRQFFQHLVAVSLAFVAASGVARLLTLALQGPTLLDTDTQVAGPLAFAVVGVPLYAAAMWWLLGQARRDDREARTLAWSLHLAVVGVVALVVAMIAGFDLVDGLLNGDPAPVVPVATLVVWGGLWGWYRWLEHRVVGSPQWAVLHVIAGSAIGLGTIVAGAGQLVRLAIDTLLFADATIVAAGEPWEPVVLLGIGLAVWGTYWLVDGMRRPRDAWWHGWVLLGGVLAGLVTMIGAGSYLLWLTAVWLVGEPGADAASHFETVPGAIAALLTSAAVWWYHRSILAPRQHRARTEVDRVHDLLLAGVGLAAAAGGFGSILVAIIEALVGPGALQVGTEPVNTLLAAVTFLVVGAPVWWRAWGRVQRLAGSSLLGTGHEVLELDENATAERRSPTRRVYLFLLFGIGGLAALTSLLAAVGDAFEDLFAGQFGLETLFSMRFAIAVLVTAAGVAALHWTVYREDRDSITEAPRRFPARITLVGVADPEIVSTLREATDAHVELWTRADGPTPPWRPDDLAAALDGHDGEHVLVLSGPDGTEVVPLQD